MGTVDDYLAGLDEADRAVIDHVYDVARRLAPDAEQGKGYGMPALIVRGKPLISVMRTRRHIGVYPFSGRVPEAVADALEGFDHDKGTIRFQPDRPLPDAAVEAVVTARLAEIDDPGLRKRPVE
ncbi:iron chaperone [Microbacterium fluvii]|uniref:Iron chaperone n=1 Tax=Microbacterium fluvii TaxID=415215 RepID=A0ABW2HIL8_9MICO|nr:DUF1801 domain-containing protein [Microbacterium fluvii]MCU4673469.1 DUF1801 domain-containing protein [Microbacterium fluvii]